MKPLVINISLRGEGSRYIPPVGLGYILTALSKADIEFELLDLDIDRGLNDDLESAIKKFSFDVVLVGCIVTGYKHVKRIASLVKKINKDAVVIAGNSVASSIPELLLGNTEVDVAVMGEGDVTVIEVLKALGEKKPLSGVSGIYYKDGGRICNTGPRRQVQDLDALPFIDWELFDIKRYLANSSDLANEPCPVDRRKRVVMSLPVARGCVYKCAFCYHVFKEYLYRIRSVGSVMKEMKGLKRRYGLNYVNFWDDVTFVNKKYCREFVDAMNKEDMGIFWNATVRGDFLSPDDAELVRDMKKAGCVGLSYSLESADKDILNSMNKKLDITKLALQKKVLDDFGISSWISIIIGYPGETMDSINKTFDFCLKNRFYPSLGYLLPQPGTQVYEYAKTKRLIKDEEEFILKMGDRQDFIINTCGIDDETMTGLVFKRLSELNEVLGLGLAEGQLVKTRCKRDSKKIEA